MFVRDGIAYAGDPMQDIRVTAAQVVNDLCMLVEFPNGEVRLFDAAPLLERPAFAPLASADVFREFSIDQGVISWLNGEIDIAPEYLYEHSYRYEKSA